MSRDYFIDDAAGRRQLKESELPLSIGGKDQAGIVLPGVEAGQVFVTIALSDGHAYLQSADQAPAIFLNNERLQGSNWLKSGDHIQIGDTLISWVVQGDKVLIDVSREIQRPELRAPQSPPPMVQVSNHSEIPVHSPASGRGQASRNRRIAGFSSVALLILSALYLLISTPVMIQINPQADTLQMQGFPPPLSLWNSRLVLPGTYTIKAERQGYISIEEQITIHMGEPANFNYSLTEKPGYLQIKTQPELALRIFVDGSEITVNGAGQAEIARGKHQIQIKADRYLPHSQTLEIDGYGQTQQLEIKLKPAWAVVTLASIPDNAAISINGKAAGFTPLTTELLEGKHQIDFRLDGFKPGKQEMEFIAGTRVSPAAFNLQPADGLLNIRSQPAGASIRLDGIFQGVTPKQLRLTANVEHRIQLSKSGYLSGEQILSLKADESQSLELKLKAEYGNLFLSTSPANASLFIDGKLTESQNGRFRLSVRPHTFKLSKPGYITQTMTLTPNMGSSQNIAIHLKTEQQHAVQKQAAATPAIITSHAGQTLRLIKPDTQLKMGASRREAGRRANENRRLIELTRPFYFASKEVSNSEYRQFDAKHDSGSLDGAGLNSDPQPVVNISWEDATRYCNWLSRRQGLPEAYIEKNGSMFAAQAMNTGYRLPTEAEWAWIARQQGQSQLQRYPWSGRYPPEAVVGNYADKQISDTLADVIPGYDDGYRGSAAVGSFKAYPEGFYDIGGNVAEWIHDYYALYPGEADKLVSNPVGPDTGTHHVVRGAGWRHGSITELRSSYRDYSSKPRYDLGFRVARYAQ